jgi:3-oxoacyl-[acyl-carrier protein] reductase
MKDQGALLENRVAIVTGGSRGIGRAIAELFALNGANLLLVALQKKGLLQAQAELGETGCNVEVVSGDISEPAVAQRIVGRALDMFGTVDILVNCAGVITRTPAASLSLKEWQRVLDVNLTGAFLLSQAVLPTMCAQRHGKIINITSQMASRPHPSASPSYEVSKAGLAALTRHFAYHYAQYGICVNAVAPGSIDTDLAKTQTAEQRRAMECAIPLGRLGTVTEVAGAALFLASNRADYITGATINVSGGSWMD